MVLTVMVLTVMVLTVMVLTCPQPLSVSVQICVCVCESDSTYVCVSSKLTGLSGEDAHEPGQQGVDGPEDLGVAAGHAGGDAPLQGLKVGQDGRGLEHRQQEAQDLQACADVGEVGLGWLLLEGGGREGTTGREGKEG